MTWREYFEEHLEEMLDELCQYQKCDNCSLAKPCEISKRNIRDILYEEMEEE